MLALGFLEPAADAEITVERWAAALRRPGRRQIHADSHAVAARAALVRGAIAAALRAVKPAADLLVIVARGLAPGSGIEPVELAPLSERMDLDARVRRAPAAIGELRALLDEQAAPVEPGPLVIERPPLAELPPLELPPAEPRDVWLNDATQRLHVEGEPEPVSGPLAGDRLTLVRAVLGPEGVADAKALAPNSKSRQSTLRGEAVRTRDLFAALELFVVRDGLRLGPKFRRRARQD